MRSYKRNSSILTRLVVLMCVAFTSGYIFAVDNPFSLPPLEQCFQEFQACDNSGSNEKCERIFFNLGAAFGRAVENGEAQKALPYARKVFDNNSSPAVLRANAALVLLSADPSNLIKVLSDKEKRVRDTAFQENLKIPPQLFVKAIDGASPSLKRTIIARLVRANAKCCKAAVIKLTSDLDIETSCAATAALGALGDANDVELLVKLRKRSDAVGKAAEEALVEIPGIGEKIFDLASTDESFLSVASKRAESAHILRWKNFVLSNNPSVRKAAWRAFGRMASPATLSSTLEWFAEIEKTEASVAAIALRNSLKHLSPEERTEKLVALWKKGSAVVREQTKKMIVNINKTESFAIWKSLASNKEYGNEAKKAYVELFESMGEIKKTAELFKKEIK